MQTSNPVLSTDVFTRYGYATKEESMTMNGVILKTAILLLIVLLSAGYVWMQFIKSGGNTAALSPWILGGAIGGLILAFATAFKPTWAPVTAPLYSLVEGVFIGGLSAMMEAAFPGIVMQATLLTFSTLFAMLAVYRSGLIRVTEKFKLGIIAATGGIMLVYLASFVLGFFNIQVPFMHGGGWMSIGFSLLVIGVAALNFILDFDFIEQATRRGAPKYMEWYAGFAIMVTLIWLYVEFLRLLSNLRGRD